MSIDSVIEILIARDLNELNKSTLFPGANVRVMLKIISKIDHCTTVIFFMSHFFLLEITILLNISLTVANQN